MEINHVHQALVELATENAIWLRNHRAFLNMPEERRERWWLHAQQMSNTLPMYRTLVAKVIEVRMR